MATYLIDYENVNKDGLNGVSKLTENDRVIIFYSSKADRMTFGLHRRLNETKAVIEYRRVDVGGHNALDFQLATYLGFLISENRSEEYCIVSNDRGFEYLAGFWRKPLYHVTRTREIAASPQAEERRQHRLQEKQEKTDLLPETEVFRSEFSDNPDLPDSDVNSPAFKDVDRTELMVLPEEEKMSSFDSDAVVFSGTPESGKKVWFTDFGESTEFMDAFSDERDVQAEKSAERREKPEAKQSQTSFEEKLRKDVEQSVSALELTDNDRGEITAYIGRYKTKLGLNNALVRRFGTQKAGEIYKSIKNLIRDKKGSAEVKKPSQQKETVLKDVRRYTSGTDLTEDDIKEISSYVSRYKTKQGVNNALVRRFRSQKAGEIYKMIKPLLKDKKGRKPSAGARNGNMGTVVNNGG